MMRSILTLLAVLLLMGNTFPKLEGQPVIDAADIIDEQTEAQLNAKLTEFWKTNDRQMVVATVTTLDGRDIESFSLDYARFLGVGSKEINDGVVLLVAPNERKVRIEVGYGLEASLTDALSHSIIQNEILPEFKAGNYPAGIVAGVDNILPNITPEALEFAAEQREKQAQREKEFKRKAGVFFNWLLMIGGAGAAGFLAYWQAILKPRKRKRKEAEAAARRERERLREEARERSHQRQLELNRQRRERERQARIEFEERQRQEQLAREKMLAAMSSTERAVFLAKEAKEEAERLERIRIAREKAEQEEAERRARQRKADEERRARQRKADEERRARQRKADEERRARQRRTSSYSSSSYGSSSSSFSSGFSGGGGSFGGGGASGSW